MNQRKKDKRHIRTQNRRKRKLIWEIFMPSVYLLLLISPVLVLATMSLCVQPREPLEATYVDCYWDGGTHKSLVLETKEHGSFMLPWPMREAVLRDLENGVFSQGDRLRITWFPWLLRRGVVTFTCGDTVYGDVESWRAHQKKDARDAYLFSSILIVVDLIASGYVFYKERKEFADIRRLKQKYKSRLLDAAEPWDKDVQE